MGSASSTQSNDLTAYTTEPLPEGKEESTGPFEVFYFSYGSNMSKEKLKTRGDQSLPPISFTDSYVGRIPDWQLCFNLRGAPPFEPVMGSIRRKPGDEVYGIVYRICSRSCWEKLLRSEGIVKEQDGHQSYEVIEVDVECYKAGNSGRTVRKAHTLITAPSHALSESTQGLYPSQRYMNLLISGAKEEGLPENYINRLEGTRVARKWGRSFLAMLMGIVIPLFFMFRRKKVGFLTKPISTIGFQLYAIHERYVLKERLSLVDRIGFYGSKFGMYAVYSAYTIPALIWLLVNARSRMFLQTIIATQKPKGKPKTQ